MLKSLADLYYGDGKDRDAILVYARLIRRSRSRPRRRSSSRASSTSAGRMGRKDAAVQQAHVFVKMLRDIEASPAAKDEKARRRSRTRAATPSRRSACSRCTYHNEWKKTRDEPVAGFAAAVYRDYLDVFPDEPTAYEMRFFHAELRYALADFEERGRRVRGGRAAGRAGRRRDGRPGGKPGKFFKDALENAVFA